MALFLNTTNNVYASSCQGVISGAGGEKLPIGTSSHVIKIDMSSGYNPNSEYYLKIKATSNTDDEAQTSSFRIDQNKTYPGGISVSNKVVTWTVTDNEALTAAPMAGEDDIHYVFLYDSGLSGSNRLCDVGTYVTSKNNTGGQCSLYVYQTKNSKKCYAPGCMDVTSNTATVEVEGLEAADGTPFNGEVRFVVGVDGWFKVVQDKKTNASGGKASVEFTSDDTGKHTVFVEEVRAGSNFKFPGCEAIFNLEAYCDTNMCVDVRTDISQNATIRDFELCEQINDGAERGKCEACFGGTSSGTPGVWTAIGCIPAKPENIIKTFITIGISIGGGATFLLILAGAFRLSVSQGDPQATKDAKEQITAALIGLIFIIMSITLLRFIGVNFFHIPGFGT